MTIAFICSAFVVALAFVVRRVLGAVKVTVRLASH